MDLHLPDALDILERTPQTVRTLLSGLTPGWTDAVEGPDTWSPYVIVGHLIHGERTDWIPRARIILEQGADRSSRRTIALRSFVKVRANRWRSCWTSSRICAP